MALAWSVTGTEVALGFATIAFRERRAATWVLALGLLTLAAFTVYLLLIPGAKRQSAGCGCGLSLARSLDSLPWWAWTRNAVFAAVHMLALASRLTRPGS